jgi:hypothetical protein
MGHHKKFRQQSLGRKQTMYTGSSSHHGSIKRSIWAGHVIDWAVPGSVKPSGWIQPTSLRIELQLRGPALEFAPDFDHSSSK